MKTKSLVFIALAIMIVFPSFSQESIKPKKRDIHRLDKDYFIPNRFKGKTILITGGARGIGKWTAMRAAKEGANVVIMDWLSEGQLVADSLTKAGYHAIFVKGNIQKDEDCDQMILAAVAKYGKIDYACLNAGVMDGTYSGTPFKWDQDQRKLMPAIITEATNEYWNNVFATNAMGTFKSMRSTLKQFLKQDNGGAIVVVGSIAGMIGLSGNPAYVSSKFAVNGLVRNAAIDYAPYGIRVNSVNMAETLTPMVERAEEFVKASVSAGEGFGMGA
ncbi:MAG: SDR family oxidoreductase, partial [Bacteroidales bacterium]